MIYLLKKKNKTIINIFILTYILVSSNLVFSQCTTGSTTLPFIPTYDGVTAKYVGNSSILNSTNIYVEPEGHGMTNFFVPTYCGTIPDMLYWVGRSNLGTTGTGSFLFNFVPPVDMVTLNFAGLDSDGSSNHEVIKLEVNNIHYPIPNIGDKHCDYLAALNSDGNIVSASNVLSDSHGWTGTEINGPISSLRVTNEMIGNTGGVIFSIAICDVNILPINLLSFSVEKTINNQVKLNWITDSEMNNDYFTIERSRDGLSWEEVTNVDGAGKSSQRLNYTTSDETPYSGITYYRLKQTDFDGNYTYSDIKAININLLKSAIIIYPNPTNGKITIQGNKEEFKNFKIYNVLGQDITTLAETISINETRKTLDLTNLSQGIYTLKTRTNVNKIYKK